jgi:4'-phosphopantetheinyl transferase
MTVRWLTRGVDHLPAGEAWLSPAERERAATMRYEKRRSEFLVARFTAKHTIARAVGLPTDDLARLATIEVRHRPTGAPMAYADGRPAGVAMSLTDRADWAVCVVANGDGVALGCDLELVEARSAGFVRDYLTSAEQAAVASADDPHLVANLLWSAKESALKVLETGLRRDTRSVEVVLLDGDGAGAGSRGEGADGTRGVVPAPGGTSADDVGWRPLQVHPEEGGVFAGWWLRTGPWLLSVAASGPIGPPVAFEEPAGLASATPSHRWAERLGR